MQKVKNDDTTENNDENDDDDDGDDEDNNNNDLNKTSTTDALKKKKKKKKPKKKSKGSAVTTTTNGGTVVAVPSNPQFSRLLSGFTDYYITYGQTDPPTRIVADLFPNGNFPLGDQIDTDSSICSFNDVEMPIDHYLT